MSNCFCDSQLNPIYKGDDATITMMVTQDDGSLMNFNGKTIKFILKKSKEDPDNEAIVSKTYSPTADTTQCDIQLTKDDTNVEPMVYWWGVRVINFNYQVTEGEGRVEIVQGAFYGK